MKNRKNNSDKNIFEKNPKKSILVILIVTIIFSAIIAEKILQYKSRPRHSGPIRYINLKEYPPRLVNWVSPPKEFLKISDNLENREYLFHVDGNGFIIPSKIHEHPDRTIVFLGGSTTECFFVDEEKRWPYVAGRLLEKETGLKVNSYNAAMSGINSLNSIDILINKVLPLKPQVVLMLHNINDLTTLLYDKTYWTKNSKIGPIIEVETSLGKNIKKTWGQLWDTAFPYLYPAIKNLTIFPKKPKQLQDGSSGSPRQKLEVDKAYLLSEFGANLELFIQICRVKKIIPVLMTQANRFTHNPEPIFKEPFIEAERTRGVNYEMFKDLYDSFNSRIREVATANKVMLIDLAEEIPQEKEYLYDVVHFTENGCQRVALIVKEKIGPLLSGH